MAGLEVQTGRSSTNTASTNLAIGIESLLKQRVPFSVTDLRATQQVLAALGTYNAKIRGGITKNKKRENFLLEKNGYLSFSVADRSALLDALANGQKLRIDAGKSLDLVASRLSNNLGSCWAQKKLLSRRGRGSTGPRTLSRRVFA